MAFHHLLPQKELPWTVKSAMYVLYVIVLAALLALVEHTLSKHIEAAVDALLIAITTTGIVVVCYLIQRHSVAVEETQKRIEDGFTAAFKRVENVYLQTRFTVEYYPAGGDTQRDFTARMYEAAATALQGAHDNAEVLSVTSFYESFKQSDADNEAHSKYFSVLENLLGRVRYSRLVQCVDTADLRAKISPPYDTHFRKVIERRDAGTTPSVLLDVVPPLYSTAYVIIDNVGGPAVLLWQMNEYVQAENPRDAMFRPRGVFVINDPDRQFVKHFRDWYNRLATSARRRALTLDDLSEPRK